MEFEPTSMHDVAMIVVDIQNDFVHPEGAYSRNGATAPDVAALPARLAPLAARLRDAGGVVIGTQFTLIPDRHGTPMIASHLKRLRPFLKKGDFAPGSWGHAMLEEMGPFDATVEKVAYSAFYQTRLDWLLRKFGISHVAMAGIVTNGGVAATLRDAFVRDYEVALLEDGCAAFSREIHDAAVKSLSGAAAVMNCADLAAIIDRAPTGRS